MYLHMYSKENWRNLNTKLMSEIAQLDRRPDSVFKIQDKILKATLEEYKDANISRNQTLRELRSKLFSLKSDLDKIQTTLKGKSSRLSDGAALRFILEEFETKLSTLKAHTRATYHELEVQVEALTKDLDPITHEIDTWENDANTGHSSSSNTNNRNKEETINKVNMKEIVKKNLEHQQKLGLIEKQMHILGGQYGGWHYKDHDVFLRIWTQTQTIPILVNASTNASDGNSSDNVTMNVFVPETNNTSSSSSTNMNNTSSKMNNNTQMITPLPESTLHYAYYTIPLSQQQRIIQKLTPLLSFKDISHLEEHIQWYLSYISLQLAKKELIQTWKESKLKQGGFSDIEVENGDEGNMKSIEDQLNTLTSTSNTMKIELTPAEKLQMKERINQWKLEKEANMQLKLNQDKELIELEKKKEDEKRRKRLQETKIQLQIWQELQVKEQEELKETMDKADQSARRPSSVDPAEIRRRQERDLELAAKRRETITRHQDAQKPKSERIAALDSNVLFSAERDPTRLTHLTKATLSHQITPIDLESAEYKRNTQGAHSARVPMSGRDLQFSRRATPTWCKPLNR